MYLKEDINVFEAEHKDRPGNAIIWLRHFQAPAALGLNPERLKVRGQGIVVPKLRKPSYRWSIHCILLIMLTKSQVFAAFTLLAFTATSVVAVPVTKRAEPEVCHPYHRLVTFSNACT